MSQKFHINAKGVPAPCRAKKGNCPYGGDETHFDTREEAQAYTDSTFGNEYGVLSEMPEEVKKSQDEKITKDEVNKIYQKIAGEHAKNSIVLMGNHQAEAAHIQPYSHRGRDNGEFTTSRGEGDLSSLYKRVAEVASYSDSGIGENESIHVASDKVYESNETPRFAGTEAVTAYRVYASNEIEYSAKMDKLQSGIQKANEDLYNFAEKNNIKNRKSKTISCKSCGERMNTADVSSHNITTTKWSVENENENNTRINVPTPQWNTCSNPQCRKSLNSPSTQKAYASKQDRVRKMKDEMKSEYEKEMSKNKDREVFWVVNWSK